MVAGDHPNENDSIKIDSRDPVIVNNCAEGNFNIDLSAKLKGDYSEAEETIDDKVPKPLFDQLFITLYVDSDHAHDNVTRSLITRLIIFVEHMPVMVQLKQ
eukprot:14231016-Ditylum_brightwellii.AAC.1